MAEEFNTKVDGVYEYIFDAIKRGDFHSDKILSERELGNLLGVSEHPFAKLFVNWKKRDWYSTSLIKASGSSLSLMKNTPPV